MFDFKLVSTLWEVIRQRASWLGQVWIGRAGRGLVGSSQISITWSKINIICSRSFIEKVNNFQVIAFFEISYKTASRSSRPRARSVSLGVVRENFRKGAKTCLSQKFKTFENRLRQILSQNASLGAKLLTFKT